MTEGVLKETKSQGFGKAMFSGEGLFLHRVSGMGIIFVASLGAIVQRQLRQGEQWIVDNGHLVAWNCPYTIERAGGGLMSGIHAGEGLVCRFTGPGTVFIQVSDIVEHKQGCARCAHSVLDTKPVSSIAMDRRSRRHQWLTTLLITLFFYLSDCAFLY
jgi:uncharacterized protein (AIM24 family)